MSPHKKKSRKSLSEIECLQILRDHNRKFREAAESIVYKYFLNVPVDDLPTQDLKEMEAVIEKIRKQLGELL